VSEVLERFFRKDADFQEYLAAYKPPEAGDQRKEEKTQALPNEAVTATKK
jgi:hypothetical protein